MSRQKLDDYNKKKLRQIRISDAEMDYLGNPDSAWIRQALKEKRQNELKLQKIKEDEDSFLDFGRKLARPLLGNFQEGDGQTNLIITHLLDWFNVNPWGYRK